MEVKYTTQFLSKLEDIFSESDYMLRYEKGNFQSGYCLLKETHVAIVNKYYPLLNTDKMTDKNKKMYLELHKS
jgi:hypothetical protein